MPGDIALAAPPAPHTLARRARRHVRLLASAIAYEARKQVAFRMGFIVREVLRGLERPVVMVFVYLAMFRATGASSIRGYTFVDLVQYLMLVAIVGKVMFHERALELSEQIFEGYVTKFVVMPFRFFTLVLGRWLQYVSVQLVVAAILWLVGMALVPRYWPAPANAVALAQALILVLMGSYCFLLLYFLVNTLAFWLDVVWTLLATCRMATGFVRGELVPISMMPAALRSTFEGLFPYWAVFAPCEILLGRQGTPEFVRGVLVLLASAVVLQVISLHAWRRGLRRYAGAGA